MAVEARRKGKVSIVEVTGKLTIGEEVRLRQVVKDLLAEGQRLFILNLQGVPFMDSAGLGETAACKMRVAGRGGTLKLVIARRGKISEILKITGLDQAFEIFHDEGEALASFIQ
jgi:anti-sigma B factor antagonist